MVAMRHDIQSLYEQEPMLESRQAKWVIGFLSMLIDVVGSRSILGMILSQSRLEIFSLLESDEVTDDESAHVASDMRL